MTIMKKPRDTYPSARVPEHLTRLTVEKLPFDSPCYILPGELDDFEPPSIFVTPDRKLKISSGCEIPPAGTYPANPIGLIGIMRTFIIDPNTRQIREVLIADLRFIEPHQLVDFDDILSSLQGQDQEEFMHAAAWVDKALFIDGFIAAEPEDDSDIPTGSLYGDELLYEPLLRLGSQSDTLMQSFLDKAAKKAAPSAKTRQSKRKTKKN